MTLESITKRTRTDESQSFWSLLLSYLNENTATIVATFFLPEPGILSIWLQRWKHGCERRSRVLNCFTLASLELIEHWQHIRDNETTYTCLTGAFHFHTNLGGMDEEGARLANQSLVPRWRSCLSAKCGISEQVAKHFEYDRCSWCLRLTFEQTERMETIKMEADLSSRHCRQSTETVFASPFYFHTFKHPERMWMTFSSIHICIDCADYLMKLFRQWFQANTNDRIPPLLHPLAEGSVQVRFTGELA